MPLSLVFISKSLLISGLLLGYYWLVLRNRKLHTFNRFYLLAAVTISLLIPTLHFSIDFAQSAEPTGVYRMLPVVHGGEQEVVAASKQLHTITLGQAISYGYLLSVIIMLGLMVSKLRWLFTIGRKASAENMDGYRIVYTDKSDGPFSFMRTVYWNNKIDLCSSAGQNVMRHELVHVRQLHTLDKLLVQVILAFFWFNPFFWLIQKELAMVHEFIADEDLDDTESFADMLLRSHFGDRMPAMVNTFFHSPIKRRLLMLTNNAPRMAALRQYAILPVMAAVAFLMSFTVNKPGSTTEIIKAKRKLLVVLDAGHGGHDRGAVGNVANEKDVTLEIARQLGSLAPDHNIAVQYTRNDDQYPTLQQRVAMANSQPADLFLSIHVNTAREPNSERFWLCVSPKNRKYNESKALASVIGSKLAAVNVQPYFLERGIHVLKESNHTALSIECSNIENAQIRDPKYMEGICRNVLNGIAEYENGIK